MEATDTNVRLGEMLVRAGKLTNEQVQEALKKLSVEKRGSLLMALMDLGHLPFTTVAQFVEKILSMKTYAIGGKVIDSKVLSLVNQRTIEQEFIFPIGIKKNKSGQEVLIVGIVDPLAQSAVENIEKEVGKKVFPVLISKPDFVDAVQRHFKSTPTPSVMPDHTVSVTVDSGNLPPIPGVGDTQKITIEPIQQIPKVEFLQKFPMTEDSTAPSPIELTQSGASFEIESSSSASAAPVKTSTFDFGKQDSSPSSTTTVGDATKRFKEEALAKLDLNPSEARLLEKETYTRELLIQDLAQISLKSLQTSVQDLSVEQKLEAIINLLLSKRIITPREVFTQYAVSKVFSSREKSNKDNL